MFTNAAPYPPVLDALAFHGTAAVVAALAAADRFRLLPLDGAASSVSAPRPLLDPLPAPPWLLLPRPVASPEAFSPAAASASSTSCAAIAARRLASFLVRATQIERSVNQPVNLRKMHDGLPQNGTASWTCSVQELQERRPTPSSVKTKSQQKVVAVQGVRQCGSSIPRPCPMGSCSLPM